MTKSQRATRRFAGDGAVVSTMAALYSKGDPAATVAAPHDPPPMPPRLRKLVALVLLVPGLAAYCLGAIVLADRVPSHWFLKLAYFVAAGLAWALPARALMRWAEKPGVEKVETQR